VRVRQIRVHKIDSDKDKELVVNKWGSHVYQCTIVC
jgi:hypothetical protein